MKISDYSQLTELIHAQLHGLVLAQNHADFLGLIVLQKANVAAATLLPLLAVGVKAEECAGPAEKKLENTYMRNLDKDVHELVKCLKLYTMPAPSTVRGQRAGLVRAK
jgi:hypothetical protein